MNKRRYHVAYRFLLSLFWVTSTSSRLLFRITSIRSWLLISISSRLLIIGITIASRLLTIRIISTGRLLIIRIISGGILLIIRIIGAGRLLIIRIIHFGGLFAFWLFRRAAVVACFGWTKEFRGLSTGHALPEAGVHLILVELIGNVDQHRQHQNYCELIQHLMIKTQSNHLKLWNSINSSAYLHFPKIWNVLSQDWCYWSGQWWDCDWRED